MAKSGCFGLEFGGETHCCTTERELVATVILNVIGHPVWLHPGSWGLISVGNEMNMD